VTKFVHLFNAAAWMVNALLWTFYAKSFFMGATSLAAVVLSYKMAQWESNQ
jgi:hypothetical protein